MGKGKGRSLPVRFTQEEIAAIEAEAPRWDQSLAQQVRHWMNIGRAYEAKFGPTRPDDIKSESL